jgi:hypothetical protein
VLYCVKCAIKHLGSAKINLIEAAERGDERERRDKLLDAMFQLGEAENHLSADFPEEAAKVRNVRKRIEAYVWEEKGELDVKPDDIEALIDSLYWEKEGESEMENPAGEGVKPFAWTECELKYPEVQEKLERCVLKVKERLPKWCLEEQAWGQTREGETCYNPWAVCRASVKCPPEG